MKISPQIKKFSTLLTIFLFLSTSANAWNGYDYENKTEIEIGEGNLVREGLMIQYYSNEDSEYHPAQVLLMESSAGGVRIEVKDLDTKKKRIFIMED